jgi:hypothetical protein
VEELNRKLILGTFFALSLATIIAVAAIAPTIVIAKQGDDDGTLKQFTYGGQVTVQLPQGDPPHPTCLIVAALHSEERSDYPLGGSDVIAVSIWVEKLNTFLPVVAVGNDDNPDHHAFIKELYMGTPLWNPFIGFENLYWVDEEDLVLQKSGDVVFANLSQGVSVSLNFTKSPIPQLKALGDLSFDLPPIALEIRGIDSPFTGGGSNTMPSGWSIETSFIRKPAWVRLWIKEWTGGSAAFKFAGVLGVHVKQTLTPPST